jgi:hypothetical protein
MKIDITKGSLIFESGSIDPHIDRPAFLEASIGRQAKVALVNQGWINMDFEPEPGVSATAFFKDDRLEKVFFALSVPSDDIKEWVEDREQQRKAKHDAWLRAELGEPPYEYSWGQVESDFDPRGWSSQILVTYAG